MTIAVNKAEEADDILDSWAYKYLECILAGKLHSPVLQQVKNSRIIWVIYLNRVEHWKWQKNVQDGRYNYGSS